MIDKQESFRKTFRLVRFFLKSESDLILRIVFGVFLSNLFLVIVPFFIQFLVSNYLNLTLDSPVILISSIIFILLIASYFMITVNYYFAELVTRRIFINNLYRILNTLATVGAQKLSPSQYSRFLELVPVGENLVKLIFELSHTIIVLVFGLLIIVSYHPYYFFYAFCLIVILIVIFMAFLKDSLIFKSHMSDIKYRIVDHLIQIAERIKDSPEEIEAADRAETYFKRMSKNYLKNSASYFRIMILKNSLIGILIAFVQALFIYISAKLIFDGSLSLGQFVSAELVLTYILASIHKLIKNLDTIFSVIVSFDKVSDLIEVK